MQPLFSTDNISDGLFVVYDGPNTRFATTNVRTMYGARGLIRTNRDIAPLAKPAYIVRVKMKHAYEEYRRALRIAIRNRAIEQSKAKQDERARREAFSALVTSAVRRAQRLD